MKRFSFQSFLCGFIVCGILMGFFHFLILLMSFDLGGGETLKQVEDQRSGWIISTSLFTIIAIAMARVFVKNADKSIIYGIRAMGITCLLIAASYCLYNNSFSEPFDKAVWQRSYHKPFRMAATLVKKEKLIGLTVNQIKNLLGESQNSGEGYIRYAVKNEWTLSVYFNNGKCVEAVMRLPFLSV